MAVYLPIISEFNSKGIDRAKREFKSLEGFGAKTAYALKKAFIPATTALAGLAKLGFDAVAAAVADDKAQLTLANTIKKVTNSTDAQIKANEDWITTQGELFGITDDNLRPALAKLVRSTKNITKAQKLANLAMDIAAATGKDLSDVTDALAKAVNNNMKSLKSLAPELSDIIKKGGTTKEVFKRLADTFGGQASEQANTASGRMQRLKVRFDEFKETLGSALLPILEDHVIPALEKLSTWAKEHPGTFKTIALAVGGLTAAVVALNFAMATNPWVLAIVGLAGLFLWAEKTTGAFSGLWKILKGILDTLLEITRLPSGIFGAVIGSDMGGGTGGNGGLAGIMAGPQVPAGGNPNWLKNAVAGNTTNVTVNVNGGDPKATVDAIVRWTRQNGRLPPQVRLAQ